MSTKDDELTIKSLNDRYKCECGGLSATTMDVC